MAITRYENVEVLNVVSTVDEYGAQTSGTTPWFKTRGLLQDVANSVRIAERYRVYSDLMNVTLNYTPNTRQIVDKQELYALNWRGYEWRITDVRESNDRMTVTFLCYRNDPGTTV